MLFSLIHPSRGRPVRAEEAIREWRGHAGGQHPLEYLLSVDDDDPDLGAYRALAGRLDVQLVIGTNRSVVDAVNRAAAIASGDLLVVVSDDFGCPSRWDEALAGVAGSRRDLAIQIHDGHNATKMTLPIVGRALYARLGYVYYPGYVSMFADDDIGGVAASLGALVEAPHLHFPHRHHSFGLAEMDSTYARQDAWEHWWSGWRLYETRRATQFGQRGLSASVAWRLLRINTYYVYRTMGSRVLTVLRGWSAP